MRLRVYWSGRGGDNGRREETASREKLGKRPVFKCHRQQHHRRALIPGRRIPLRGKSLTIIIGASPAKRTRQCGRVPRSMAEIGRRAIFPGARRVATRRVLATGLDGDTLSGCEAGRSWVGRSTIDAPMCPWLAVPPWDGAADGP